MVPYEDQTDLLDGSRENMLMVNEYEGKDISPRRQSLGTNRIESRDSRQEAEGTIASSKHPTRSEQREEQVLGNMDRKWQEGDVLALVPYYGPEGEIKETAVMLR